MSNFRTRLPKWAAVLRGDNSHHRRQRGGERGGGKPSSIELLPPDSQPTQGQPNSFSSAWKPVWYTGWHTGVLACATCVVVVLLINVSLTIYAVTNPEYKMEKGIGTLYSGSCDKSRTIGLWLHLGINALSTLLLSGSNYTQQCLAAPTRGEIDAVHARRRWMDIGVPSVRNLFRIKPERALLWILIGITSIPLHLLYNSAVYTSLAANEFLVAVVSNKHFKTGAWANKTRPMDAPFRTLSVNTTTGKEFGDLGYQTDSHGVQLFVDMLEGFNDTNLSYQYLTPFQCAKVYNTDFLSDHRNLFLITNYTTGAMFDNSTLLEMGIVTDEQPPPDSLKCRYFRCEPNELTSRMASGHPWMVSGDAITGCMGEITKEKCKVQFSLFIMIVVICCNVVKACGMIMTIVRSREPTLVTLGDAIDSFLRIPDPTTIGICYADRRFIEKEWRGGSRAGPRQWKQKGVQRWWSSASKTRWITCNFLCLTTIMAAGVLLLLGIRHDGYVFKTNIRSMWTRGFGKVNSVSLIQIPFRKITQAIFLANLPQTALSFLYLTYNSLFTCMLAGHEWSLFSRHHRTLRVTSPRPGQRSTYWLQIPYTYAVPLMTLSGLLHWLTSQSIFLARVEISDPFGRKVSTTINSVGYSCIAIIFVLTLGVLALLVALGMGYKQFSAEITTVGSCSAAISAACHAWGEDSEEIVGKKVRWGDVGIIPNLGAGHLTFSSEEGVRKPVFGEVYAGAVREERDRL